MLDMFPLAPITFPVGAPKVPIPCAARRAVAEDLAMREIVRLVTEDGKSTYVTKKNRRTHPERMEVKKYSKYHRKHMTHREKR
jgi:large subunit ribosomal protein L33